MLSWKKTNLRWIEHLKKKNGRGTGTVFGRFHKSEMHGIRPSVELVDVFVVESMTRENQN